MTVKIECFKAYDLRGRIPDQLNADIAYRVANAAAEFLCARTMVIGRDMRLSSEEFADAVSRGLMDAGVKVLDIGLCGTEMVYFATGHLGADGGIMITASHNPADYNGMKFVGKEARPISQDTGLQDIRRIAQGDRRLRAAKRGKRIETGIMKPYLDRLLSFIDPDKLKPLSIVVNAGNGCAGLVVDELEPVLPLKIIKIFHEPDGTFPNGVPNPMLEGNRQPTIEAIRKHGADLGIAWDGDFDRCFFFDENGRFIEGYYIVGLLAQSLLETNPGARIIFDPRLTWNTIEVVQRNGGIPVQSKSGHSFMKQAMRDADAIYGGEMSAHHYFRDFYYCDSGMLPWLLVAQLVSLSNTPLSQLVDSYMKAYPSSGELNRHVDDVQATIAMIRKRYDKDAVDIDDSDGISLEFRDWRFNLRGSNTEPVIRLNVESRGNASLMSSKVNEINALLDKHG